MVSYIFQAMKETRKFSLIVLRKERISGDHLAALAIHRKPINLV